MISRPRFKVRIMRSTSSHAHVLMNDSYCSDRVRVVLALSSVLPLYVADPRALSRFSPFTNARSVFFLFTGRQPLVHGTRPSVCIHASPPFPSIPSSASSRNLPSSVYELESSNPNLFHPSIYLFPSFSQLPLYHPHSSVVPYTHLSFLSTIVNPFCEIRRTLVFFLAVRFARV
jgi:hypothetical protein